uniref:Uncharacterized protein n=1 Tax=Lotharella oceanica TaxID=641309 RepID=A0A7S2TZ59_9EUKA|mmetsp:Transcript_34743/g.64316  ORF Transcript_34743/g.64316 Transcript_34743/m.64316 type:complete len:126 (+) Transcript_34743:53-430(+)|eukprot:CAMPEP_0170172354 /NCGR_PEP_ID=MMETSP0040_2-20121228/5589_1 /TAXON_ID=641309 /ORGANISM="Lotharella oceanica, Strain CCMP622" /LENGTH=125 /DNA_ID=CAMNT_0010412973 /DNA_START=38 /DNA_END=415 /DNA_ORIENTATION=-
MKLLATLVPLAVFSNALELVLSKDFMMGLANGTHYGDPADGCLSDEVAVQIEGISGDFCTPTCNLFKPCPTDVPPGVTASPMCALQDASTGQKYCALICSPGGGNMCGDATCKAISGIGICTYDD